MPSLLSHRSVRRKWRDLPLRWKGCVIVGIPILPLFAIALIVVLMMGSQQRAEEGVTHTLEVQGALHAVEIAALNAETSVRGFVLTGDQSWLQPFEEERRQLPQHLTALRTLVSDNPTQLGRLGRITELTDARLRILAAIIPFAGPAEPPESLMTQGHEWMTALRSELHALDNEEAQALAARRARLDIIRRRMRALIVVAAVIGIAGGLSGVWLFIGSVTRRIRQVDENAQRLARGEPLVVPTLAADEIGHLEQGLENATRLLEERVLDLQVARDELDRFFGLSLDLLCIANVEGQFQRLNPAWEQTLGWTTDDLTSTEYTRFVHPDDQEGTLQQASRLADGGSVVSFSNRYRCKDGSYRWLSWKAAAHPQRGRVYAAARDVTDERRAAEDLHRHAAELAAARLSAEQANQAKTTFLSHMSHDLRTPLNAILGFAQLLEHEALSDEQRDSVRQIRSGGQHLLELISEVIDITRIESGQLSLSPEGVSVAEVVGRAVELVKPLAAQHGLALGVDPLPPGLAVLADRQRVHQVLLNFLSNAVKYNRPHGRISVGIQVILPGRCRLNVSDTGAGLSEEKLALLFQPFQRLGAEQTTIEGTGLGLALSRTIAEAMGGSVGVRSLVDQGTTFWLELPVAEALIETRSRELPSSPEMVNAKQARCGVVLYIEDNHANVRLMERILGRRPELVFLSASSGEAGERLARERHPDLIFLDMHLPDMTGEEVLWRLWRDPDTRDIPSVILTADVTPGLGRRLLAAGAKDHLTKPLDVTRVLTLVDHFLHEPKVLESISH